MNTDRELLELAAKAAGFKELPPTEGFFLPSGFFFKGGTWNPLTNDGDALRLAVKLAICVRHDDASAVLAGWTPENFVPFTLDQRGPWYWKEWLRDHGDNRNAATRRAIVRAAAEIGRAMP